MKLQLLKNHEVIKFMIVGMINTIIGAAVMFVFYNLIHFSYWISSACNYIVGSIVSYFLNKYWTFQNKEKNYKTALKFVLNILICYLFAYGIAKPAVIWLMKGFPERIQDNVAMIIGMILFTVANYFGQKKFAFRQGNEVLEKNNNIVIKLK